jgi:hypothetical protein
MADRRLLPVVHSHVELENWLRDRQHGCSFDSRRRVRGSSVLKLLDDVQAFDSTLFTLMTCSYRGNRKWGWSTKCSAVNAWRMLSFCAPYRY